MYIHLVGSKDVILERMKARTNHYFAPTMLDSQFDALEATDNEPDIVQISIERPISAITEDAMALIQEFVQGVQTKK
jgi:gluconokinase